MHVPLGDHSNRRLDLLDHDVEVAADGLFLLAEPRGDLAELRVHLAEPRVDPVEPRVDPVEPRVDPVEPRVHLAEPRIDGCPGLPILSP